MYWGNEPYAGSSWAIKVPDVVKVYETVNLHNNSITHRQLILQHHQQDPQQQFLQTCQHGPQFPSLLRHLHTSQVCLLQNSWLRFIPHFSLICQIPILPRRLQICTRPLRQYPQLCYLPYLPKTCLLSSLLRSPPRPSKPGLPAEHQWIETKGRNMDTNQGVKRTSDPTQIVLVVKRTNRDETHSCMAANRHSPNCYTNHGETNVKVLPSEITNGWNIDTNLRVTRTLDQIAVVLGTEDANRNDMLTPNYSTVIRHTPVSDSWSWPTGHLWIIINTRADKDETHHSWAMYKPNLENWDIRIWGTIIISFIATINANNPQPVEKIHSRPRIDEKKNVRIITSWNPGRNRAQRTTSLESQQLCRRDENCYNRQPISFKEHKNNVEVWIVSAGFPTIQLSLNLPTTTKALKEMIASERGIPSHLLVLKHKGHLIPNRGTVTSLIRPGAFIYVELNGLQGGVKHTKNTKDQQPHGTGKTKATRKPVHRQAIPLPPSPPETNRNIATSIETESDERITTPWKAWHRFLNLADHFKLFQFPRTLVQKTTRNLQKVLMENANNNSELTTMGSTILCIATMGEGPILTTILTGRKREFAKYCESTRGKTAELKVKAETLPNDEIFSQFWRLATTVLKPTLHALQDKLPRTAQPILLYKGLQATNGNALEDIMNDLEANLPPSWVWTSSLETAIINATPNRGMKGKLSLIDRRLLRKGHHDLVTNWAGVVLAYRTIAIPIGDITPSNHTNEYFAKGGSHSRKRTVEIARIPKDKLQLLRSVLPNESNPALPKIINSTLWVTTITDPNTFAPITEPKKTTTRSTDWRWEKQIQKKHWEPPHLANTIRTPSTTTPADAPPIAQPSDLDTPARTITPSIPTNSDNTTHPACPPNLRRKPNTRWDIPRPQWPTRIVIQGHTFWRANKKSCPVQKWTFDIADKCNHRVCTVLLWQKSRLYGSFQSAESFWDFYSQFQGRRCFYWINRSSQIKREASILHFDIEWYTKVEDPKATEKIKKIKGAIAVATPTNTSMLGECLSRPHQENGWKNSFHIYTDFLLEHNADGCMRQWVKNKIWKLLQGDQAMWCPSTGKPILDLGIYTKNRTFRVPGSCKRSLPQWPHTDPPTALPTKAFFMRTRMADRRVDPINTTIWHSNGGKDTRADLNNNAQPRKRRKTPIINTSPILNLETKAIQHPSPHPTNGEQRKRKRFSSMPCDGQQSHKLSATTPGPWIDDGHISCPPPSMPKATHNPIEKEGSHQGSENPRIMTHNWRYMCPITGCKNFGGRGYARSTFIDHLNTHCLMLLANENERARALDAAATFGGLSCCESCGKLNLEANARRWCRKCSNETQQMFAATRMTLSESAKHTITHRIREANKTEIRIISDIPPLLRRLWSRCVSTTLESFLSARSDTESFKALESWTKLKSVLVLPVKGGSRRKRSTYKHYEKRMVQWIAGLHDLCWDDAKAIERDRKRNQRRSTTIKKNPTDPYHRNESENKNTREETILKRKFDRAKRFVNVGEYSQAMNSILSNGTAPITDSVLDQLAKKHPPRLNTVVRPSPTTYESEFKESPNDMDMDIDSEMKDHTAPSTTERTGAHEAMDNTGLSFPSISVSRDDILQAASSAKRYTSGGLQQITPWHLKRAMQSMSDDDCAMKAALLVTRWGRGDYSTSLGELMAESKLIALYKDEKKIDVRPISVGCALRRLLTKAYCARTRARIKSLVQDTQLGVLKGGYEIGVHTMRSLCTVAEHNNEGILLLDFANAFNTVDRKLMILLTAKDCPELANLTWWLYKMEPQLVTSRGDIIRSSSGTQQGCRLSNPLFALTMQYIGEKLQGIKGLRKTLFYWDDTALVGTPKALAQATKVLNDLAAETGLRLKWSKCHLHGLPATIDRCTSLPFPIEITLHNNFNMEYLKAPIGDHKYVKDWLEKKLSQLDTIVALLAQMPHKHEAATLLKSTSAVCRVVYLMRILPPSQINDFMRHFDAIVRSGFEKILGIPINDLWWEIAKLPTKYGGMGWKTGSHTYGAHFIASLAKTSESACRIAPSHKPMIIAQHEAAEWLKEHAPPDVTTEAIISAIRSPKSPGRNTSNLSQIKLSIAQQCDEWHWKKLIPRLCDQELSHVLAHSGSTNWWVSCVPLEHKRWNMAPNKWKAAVRRRLYLDVIPAEQQCPYCHWQKCDTKGNHAVMCRSGPSRIWRHNAIRNLLAKAIQSAGFRIGYEHGGELNDERRPGDIIIYNWTRDKHLLIDVGVTNPLASHNRSALIKNGPGGGAAAMERRKRNKYKDLDSSKYTYHPFALETGGAFGKPALQLCAKLRKIWMTKCCAGGDSPNHSRNPSKHNTIDPLLVSISILLQSHNGQMILERSPPSPDLLDSQIALCQARSKTQKQWAAERLQALEEDGPATLHRLFLPPKKTTVHETQNHGTITLAVKPCQPVQPPSHPRIQHKKKRIQKTTSIKTGSNPDKRRPPLANKHSNMPKSLSVKDYLTPHKIPLRSTITPKLSLPPGQCDEAFEDGKSPWPPDETEHTLDVEKTSRNTSELQTPKRTTTTHSATNHQQKNTQDAVTIRRPRTSPSPGEQSHENENEYQRSSKTPLRCGHHHANLLPDPPPERGGQDPTPKPLPTPMNNTNGISQMAQTNTQSKGQKGDQKIVQPLRTPSTNIPMSNTHIPNTFPTAHPSTKGQPGKRKRTTPSQDDTKTDPLCPPNEKTPHTTPLCLLE